MSDCFCDGPARVIGPPFGPGRSRRIYWRGRIARRIHEARETQKGIDDKNRPKMTRSELGAQLGFNEQMVWEIENGISGLSLEDFVHLCEALNVHPGSFFDEGVFQHWATPNAGRLGYATIAKAIEELEKPKRDIIIQLILFLAENAEHRAKKPFPGQVSWA